MIGGITDRTTFVRLRSKGRHVRAADLALRHLADPVDHESVRIAYAIPRKVGNAVVRNRLRRRIRGVIEEMRANDKTVLAGDTLVIARAKAGELGYTEVRSQVIELMGMLEEKEKIRS